MCMLHADLILAMLSLPCVNSVPSHPSIIMSCSKELQSTYEKPRTGESNLLDLLKEMIYLLQA